MSHGRLRSAAVKVITSQPAARSRLRLAASVLRCASCRCTMPSYSTMRRARGQARSARANHSPSSITSRLHSGRGIPASTRCARTSDSPGDCDLGSRIGTARRALTTPRRRRAQRIIARRSSRVASRRLSTTSPIATMCSIGMNSAQSNHVLAGVVVSNPPTYVRSSGGRRRRRPRTSPRRGRLRSLGAETEIGTAPDSSPIHGGSGNAQACAADTSVSTAPVPLPISAALRRDLSDVASSGRVANAASRCDEAPCSHLFACEVRRAAGGNKKCAIGLSIHTRSSAHWLALGDCRTGAGGRRPHCGEGVEDTRPKVEWPVVGVRAQPRTPTTGHSTEGRGAQWSGAMRRRGPRRRCSRWRCSPG